MGGAWEPLVFLISLALVCSFFLTIMCECCCILLLPRPGPGPSLCLLNGCSPSVHSTTPHQRQHLPYQGKKSAENGNRAERGNVNVHVPVLLLGEQRVLALNPAAFDVLIPALGIICPDQRDLALPRAVEFDVLDFVLHWWGGVGWGTQIKKQRGERCHPHLQSPLLPRTTEDYRAGLSLLNL